MRGTLENNSISIPLAVHGVSVDLQQSVVGIIDTGYAGYLTLPFSTAFPIGLVLRGQQSYTLADGSVSNHFVCVGTVTFGVTSVVVPIDVHTGSPILIGVQLLKKMQTQLTINFAKETFEFAVSNQPGPKPLKGITLGV
jgi:predicted aspartyl protease